MAAESPHIDERLFYLRFHEFKAFIQEKAPQVRLDSFASHEYVKKEEAYKYEVYEEARVRLGYEKWKKSEIGEGQYNSGSKGRH